MGVLLLVTRSIQSLYVSGCRGEERLAAQLESGCGDSASRPHVDDQREDLAHLLRAGDGGVGPVDVLGESMAQRLVVDDHAFGCGTDRYGRPSPTITALATRR